MLDIVSYIIVYFVIGAITAYYYHQWKQRDLPGGYWGALIIAIIGAVIINYILSIRGWFPELINWLMVPKIGYEFRIGVNLIAAIAGAFLFVYILNKINHDRERR